MKISCAWHFFATPDRLPFDSELRQASVRNQAGDQVDKKVDSTSVPAMFHVVNIFKLIVHRLNQRPFPEHNFVPHRKKLFPERVERAKICGRDSALDIYAQKIANNAMHINGVIFEKRQELRLNC